MEVKEKKGFLHGLMAPVLVKLFGILVNLITWVGMKIVFIRGQVECGMTLAVPMRFIMCVNFVQVSEVIRK